MLMDLAAALRCCQPAFAAVLIALALAAQASANDLKPGATFLKRHCADCHEGKSAEGNLDLAALSHDLADSRTQQRWVRIFDRVKAGEMPPKDADKPKHDETAAFLRSTGSWL